MDDVRIFKASGTCHPNHWPGTYSWCLRRYYKEVELSLSVVINYTKIRKDSTDKYLNFVLNNVEEV